jgi:pilus assembly protein CpaF
MISSQELAAQVRQSLIESIDSIEELGERRPVASSRLELLRDSEAEITGYGALQQFLDDLEIEEIWINEPNLIRCVKTGVTTAHPCQLSNTQIDAIVQRMLIGTSRRIDRLNPFVDSTLPDGSRLHVVAPPISRTNWLVNIRKFPQRCWTLDMLLQRGALDQSQVERLSVLVRAGANILVSGPTHAGKTSMVSALLSELNPDNRVVSVEDTFELRLANVDWAAMQTRPSASETGSLADLRRLVRESLRMRPDALVVGEVRGPEALDLLVAINSGIQAFGTIHANTAVQALEKFALLASMAERNLDFETALRLVRGSVSVVVQLGFVDGDRRVIEILEVQKP